MKRSRIFKSVYLERTKRFYEQSGGKAIVFARSVRIVRTFASFLAGVGSMSYSRFGLYHITGSALWVASLRGAWFLFSEIQFVKNNFPLVILIILALLALPAAVEAVRMGKGSLC